MNIDQVSQQLVAAVKKEATPLTIQEWSQRFNCDSSDDYPEFIKLVAQLQRNGYIEILDNGGLVSKKSDKRYQGSFSLNQKGFGFVSIEGFDDDIFIPRGETGGAMNGDQVAVQLTKRNRGEQKDEGTITEVLERALSRVTGEFVPYNDKLKAESGYIGGIRIQNKGEEMMTCFVLSDGLHPVEGEIVIAEIAEYPSLDQPLQMTGRVIQTIGHKDAPGVDILAILNMFDIPHEFPEEVLDEAEEVPEQIDPEETKKRDDYRSLLTITIDGADAKDLDDAISLRKLGNGHLELGVHIADVSYYVTAGSAIDKEAWKRGTSVYLTDRVVPMLPQRLSNGICSLQANQDRLTMSCLMEIDPQSAKVVKYHIGPSIIQSDYRMVYDDVNKLLEGKDKQLAEKYAELIPMLNDMAALHQSLRDKRHHRGAIDFDTPEAEIIVDKEGHPIDIVVRERGTAERMIESFMLAANETVAHEFTKRHLPFIYRIHESPDDERMKTFIEFAQTLGVHVKKTDGKVSPKDLQNTLEEAAGESYAPVVQVMALRSMQQAKYDLQPIGHYGLAAKDYTHFTSPIRRYPDLLAHRLIRYYLTHKPNPAKKDELSQSIEKTADQASKTERRSVDAERETESLKKTEFMLDKVGEEFDGIISSVTKFGIFVQLANTVEGLVHISNLDDDYYNYVDKHMILVGEHTGNIYRIGDQVRVKLVKADTDSRQIDFEIINPEKKTKKNNSKPKKTDLKGKNTQGHKKHSKKAKKNKHKKKHKKQKNKKNFVIRKAK
ncbi:ribonuclease R [Aerococcus loyolae]|uniref:ribonuclease R n=1 Tax=Aerococcus loyolae TaxID=2976809 RepID=UPI001248E95D|nr:ribonuclease R [Aerococcus loyolae]KAA9218667.1 ribonuclease R [Aerococcus loyolae]